MQTGGGHWRLSAANGTGNGTASIANATGDRIGIASETGGIGSGERAADDRAREAEEDGDVEPFE